MIRFEVKTKHPSLNEWLSGTHWRKKAADKIRFEEEILWELKAQSFPRLRKCVQINVTAFRSRTLDVDNVALSAKFFADALRMGGYIKNDTPEFIKSVTLQSQKINTKIHEEKVVYLITEC